jgi:hypothetical protein
MSQLMLTGKKTRRVYVGYKAEKVANVHYTRAVLFRSPIPVTEGTHGKEYDYVVGPFRTARGGKALIWYGWNNPHCLSVTDAEKIAKDNAAELDSLPRERMRA